MSTLTLALKNKNQPGKFNGYECFLTVFVSEVVKVAQRLGG